MRKVIGILGGVASGKSVVSSLLVKAGAEIFDADRAGHEALRDPAVKKVLRETFGPEILTPEGEIDRKALGGLVFGPAEDAPENRQKLNAIAHPYITARWREFLEDAVRRGAGLVVLDAPLLLEAGLDAECDEILFVDTPAARRLDFAAARGWTPQQWSAREQSQVPLEEKRDAATWILDNSRDLAFLEAQVASFLEYIETESH